MFADHTRKSIKVYINDILVKSIQADDHLDKLREASTILLKYNMKLNPDKYAFPMGSHKFLDFLVSNRGIDARLVQIKANEEIPKVSKN